MNGIYRLLNILATDGNHPESHVNKCVGWMIKEALREHASQPAPIVRQRTRTMPTRAYRVTNSHYRTEAPTPGVTRWMRSMYPQTKCVACGGAIRRGDRIGRVNRQWMCEACATIVTTATNTAN